MINRKQVLIFLNVHLLVQALNTLPCRLVQDLNLQKPISRNTIKILLKVKKRKEGEDCFLKTVFFFYKASLEELIRHGLQALRDTLQQDKELNIENTSIAIVGEDHPFEMVEGEGLQRYLDLLGDETGRTSAAVAPEETEAMDTAED
jgi:hypothetical protein